MLDFFKSLQIEEVRRKTILWLRGTGLNAWGYYGFLENFSIDQLNQFEKIIATSGGAAVFWLYVLSLKGHFCTTKVMEFDHILRKVMNTKGFYFRACRVFHSSTPYSASQYMDLLQQLVDERGFGWTWDQFPVHNFRILVTKNANSYYEFGEVDTDFAFSLAPLIAVGGTPASGQDFKIVGAEGTYSDFEYADRRIKRAYKDNLISRFPLHRKLIVNARLECPEASGNCSYLKMSYYRWPASMQLIDFICLFLNIRIIGIAELSITRGVYRSRHNPAKRRRSATLLLAPW